MVDSGVPQGSVLGPILFLIYVDDAARDLDCEVAMFADDMKIWSVIRGPADEDRLQMNLNRLEEKSNRWLLRFNVAKCSILRLGNTARSASTRGYFLGGAALQEVEAQRDLGVLTTSSLKPSAHCSRVAKTAMSVLRLDVAKIRQVSTAEALSREIRTWFTTRADGEVSNQWSSLKTSVYGAAEKILGYTQRRRSDWISGRTLQLSAQTSRARSLNDDYFRQLRKMTAKSARNDRKQYWAEIATSMEQASNVGDIRKLYRLIRQVSSKPSTLSDSVRDVNGGFIADNSAKVERWREHFEHNLNFDNQPTPPLLSSSGEFLLSPTYAVPCDPPSEGDVADAIRKLRNNKAPGEDGIPAEVFKSYQQPTAVCFIDFAAAFDSVHRESLWRIMALDCVPAKIIAMIKAYYRSTTARVLVRHNLSQPFGIRSGVRQGCILSPILFNYAIDWILGRALRENDGVEFAPGHRLTDLDYADDIALLASSFGDLQSMVSRVTEVAKSVGLSINAGKTKVFSSCIPDQEKAPLGIDGCQLGEVDSFKYLGARLLPNGQSKDDFVCRIDAAAGFFQAFGNACGTDVTSPSPQRFACTVHLSCLTHIRTPQG
nr:unnamed protein product [Spirometra erinaceieuropaei]